MKPALDMRHEFVDVIPDDVLPGVLYIAMKYSTAVHRCACGCGGEVVTPFSPRDWYLKFDGESVTLFPSIGNWSFACQSHYWIIRGRIRPARRWSRAEIDAARLRAGDQGPRTGRDSRSGWTC